MSRRIAKNSLAGILSCIIALVAAITSAGGLLFRKGYHNNDFVKSAWFTNDIITLFVVIPIFIISIRLAQRGSGRWLLIWLVLPGYLFYNFAFYLFGAALNYFFIFYAALFSLSAISLVLLLPGSVIKISAGAFSEKAPVKWISIYLLLNAGMLFMVEMSMLVPFFISGILPETVILTGHPMSVVFALDFSIVIPASIIAVILLW